MVAALVPLAVPLSAFRPADGQAQRKGFAGKGAGIEFALQAALCQFQQAGLNGAAGVCGVVVHGSSYVIENQ
jgi:hypothetical protein